MASPEDRPIFSDNSDVLQNVFDLLLTREKDGIPEATPNAEIIQQEWDRLDHKRRILYPRVVAAMFPNDLDGQQRAAQVALLLRRFEREVTETEQLNAALGIGAIATESSAEVV